MESDREPRRPDRAWRVRNRRDGDRPHHRLCGTPTPLCAVDPTRVATTPNPSPLHDSTGMLHAPDTLVKAVPAGAVCTYPVQ